MSATIARAGKGSSATPNERSGWPLILLEKGELFRYRSETTLRRKHMAIGNHFQRYRKSVGGAARRVQSPPARWAADDRV